MKKCKTNKVKKYRAGTKYVSTPDYGDMYAKQQQMKSQQNAAVQGVAMGANMIVPGSGAIVNMADSVSGMLTNDKEFGVRKDDFLSRKMDPLGGIKALASGDKDIILDQYTMGLAGKSALEKAKEMKPAADLAAQTRMGNMRQSGVDGTTNQRLLAEDGMNISSKKPIEVEKDELILRKVGNIFKLKADFQKGKTHEQGGEPYMAKEGDVIFPGKMRKKVLSALNKQDYRAIETMRQMLPPDTPSKEEFRTGTSGVEGTGKPSISREEAIKEVFALIEKAEAGGGRGYNATYKNLPEYKNIDLGTKTIAEIRKLQEDLKKKAGSSAIGKYQFMPDTLNELGFGNYRFLCS